VRHFFAGQLRHDLTQIHRCRRGCPNTAGTAVAPIGRDRD
jgi:hypothetical protein